MTPWQEQAQQLAYGLLEIAAGTMPDSYYESDSRCERARIVLALMGETFDARLQPRRTVT